MKRRDKRQLALDFNGSRDTFNLEDLPSAPIDAFVPLPKVIIIESRWSQTFWRDMPPGGSRADDMVFQIRRDLAALEDGPDAFLEERVARYRACIVAMMGQPSEDLS